MHLCVVFLRHWQGAMVYLCAPGKLFSERSWGGEGPLEIISPCWKDGQLQQVVQGCVKLGFEPLCGWRPHSLLWIYYQVTTKMHGSSFQGAKSTCISWIFIAAPPLTSFTACFQVAISNLAAGSPNQPIWADLSPHCCYYTRHVYSCFPQKEVDGSRRMPVSTSQLLWCNFQPLQVEEPLHHQRRIN